MGFADGIYNALYSSAAKVADQSRKVIQTIGTILRRDQLKATSRWNRVIVRLDLYVEQGRPPAYGTGFFLNIPGSQQDIIVTAGHNLIQPGPNGPKATPKIGIRLIDADKNAPVTVFATPDAYRIAEPFRIAPGAAADSAYDYGIILVDRPIVNGKPRPREAFGFNVMLASMNLSTDEPGVLLPVHVAGYPGMKQKKNWQDPPIFEQGNGQFSERMDDIAIYYRGGTDYGMSGSPAWVNFQGEELVVGIHTEHEYKAGEGNRGVRLSLDVMDNICNWAGINDGLWKKAIRAHPENPKLPDGVFVQSMLLSDKFNPQEPHCCYAWSGPLRDPALTTFDIILAQSSPNYSRTKRAFYLVATSTSNGPRRFLELDTDPNSAPKQIRLTEKPNPFSLVKLSQGMGSKNFGDLDANFRPKDPFKIMVAQNHDTERQSKSQTSPEFKLTLWPGDIPPAHDPFGLDRARLGLFMRAQSHIIGTPYDDEREDFILV